MLRRSTLTLLLILVFCCEAFSLPRPEDNQDTDNLPLVPIAVLEQKAQARVDARSRLPLMEESAELFKDVERLEENGRTPNYLRALASLPGAVKPFARLIKTAIYSGAVAPEVKMAMGLRIAQVNSSPYVAAHTQRMLSATTRGKALLKAMKDGKDGNDRAARLEEKLALRYADSLTRDVHGVSDEDFQKLRGQFNDSQIVELTMTVCFFNYFTRFCEAALLPVEPWALNSSFKPKTATNYEPPAARVGLISDEEISAVAETVAAAKDSARQSSGLGLGVANSQRAMMRSPEFALAWRAYGASVREYASVNREIKLHISFAVSMVNGCRYCVLHQVLGLRRLNVDPAKLMAMKKDDKALTARELTAVEFARKLTRDPSSITDGDYEKLKAEFTEQGAIEALLQTCAFSFMNRFTDGLHLPSEDEAIRVYKEVYGSEWKETSGKK
jgi:AhpD family alkylhydroperoxidase